MSSICPISFYFPGRRFPSMYNFEANRYATFKNWNNDYVFASSLARAGFVYTGTDVQCPFCCFIHNYWCPGHKPQVVHEDNCPDCPFVTGTFSTDTAPNIHIPVRDSKHAVAELIRDYSCQVKFNLSGVQESGLQNNKDTSLRPLMPGVNLRSVRSNNLNRYVSVPTAVDGSLAYTAYCKEKADGVKHPYFESLEPRQQTFKSFPGGESRLTARMSKYDFFYSGYKDLVVCFWCNVALLDWSPHTDPKIAHARWCPTCQFLRSATEPGFVDSVYREQATVGHGS